MAKFRKYIKRSRKINRVFSKKKNTITKRKNVRFRNTVSVGKGFPKKMVMTHKYVDLISMTASGGTVATRQFVCNGMYDPDYTGTGHQPMYFDQMSALYNHYTVIGSKITVKTVNSYGPASSPAYWFTLAQNDDGTISYNSLSTQSERGDGKTRLVTAGSTSTPYAVNKWSAKKTFGGSVLANDRLTGDIGANPTEITNWVIALQAVDLVSSVTTDFLVTIEYIAVWDELREISPS